jgi:uncharacterized membrane protein YdfJ with MMPL/SSD domain
MSAPAPGDGRGGWERLADLTYLRAGRLLAAAALITLLALPATFGVFGAVDPFDISNPSSESIRAVELYAERTGERPEPEVILLVEGGESEAEAAAGRLAGLEGISRTISPDRDPRLYDSDGTRSLVLGILTGPDADLPAVGEAVEDEFAPDEGVQVGGSAVALHQISVQAESDVRTIELFAAPLLTLLLLLIFRSVVASMLTAAVGILSILLTLAAVRGIAAIGGVDLFALQVITGLGAGLAIDYSLFIITRYRTELARGEGFRAAHASTVAIAGRTVATSAITVAAAMLALAIFPEPFLRSTGIAAGIVALLAGLTAVVLLPAALALLGPAVDAGQVVAARSGDDVDGIGGGQGRRRPFWERAAQLAIRRPLPIAAVGLTVTVALALPALGGEIVSASADSLPSGDSARQVAKEVVSDFERVPATTLTVVVADGVDIHSAEVAAARRSLAAEGVRFRPMRVPGAGISAISAESDVNPISDAGGLFVEEVRAADWPAGTLITGTAALQADERASIGARAPLAIVLVVLISVFMVLQLLRSWLLALLAVFMNLLTVAASYGLVVAIFTGDLVPDLLGFTAQPGIDASVPVLTFAVVFGLSTDYGIFLFSGIAEARAKGADHEEAIVLGVGRTGRVITAAAALFALAIGAFVFSDLFIVKEFAVAISLAVILDATLMRGLIAPSALKLIGPRVWAQGTEARGRMFAGQAMRVGEGP